MKRRGSNVERELQRKLWDKGIVCLRIAGSGSSSYPALDLLALYKGKVFGFEVKSTRLNTIYLKDIQIDELERIRDIGKIKIYIAVKFIGRKWYFFDLEKVKDNKKIDLERAEKEGKTFIEIVDEIKYKN